MGGETEAWGEGSSCPRATLTALTSSWPLTHSPSILHWEVWRAFGTRRLLSKCSGHWPNPHFPLVLLGHLVVRGAFLTMGLSEPQAPCPWLLGGRPLATMSQETLGPLDLAHRHQVTKQRDSLAGRSLRPHLLGSPGWQGGGALDHHPILPKLLRRLFLCPGPHPHPHGPFHLVVKEATS